MTESPLYLSYGMPKSGSTLAFQLVRTILEKSGIPQESLSEGVVDSKSSNVNFISKLDGPALDVLLDEASGLARPLAIKTHSRLFPRIRQALSKGRLLGHAVCRDPRDTALSVLDAAREGRAWGSGPKGAFRTVRETLPRLHSHIEAFQGWAGTPNVMPIHYERLAFDTETVAGEIAAQIGVRVDLAEVVRIATTERFIQFNQGKSQRWKTQMDPADARHLEIEFKDYIETYCSVIPEQPQPRKPPSRFFGNWFRKS